MRYEESPLGTPGNAFLCLSLWARDSSCQRLCSMCTVKLPVHHFVVKRERSMDKASIQEIWFWWQIWVTDLNKTGNCCPLQTSEKMSCFGEEAQTRFYTFILRWVEDAFRESLGRHVGKWDHKTHIFLFLAVVLKSHKCLLLLLHCSLIIYALWV